MLARFELKELIAEWNRAWNAHDLEKVMVLFHEDILFDNWAGGTVKGKAALKKAWAEWFENHGNFKFVDEDISLMKQSRKFCTAGLWNGTAPFDFPENTTPVTRRSNERLAIRGCCHLS